MAATDIILYGHYQLAGNTVTVQIGGLDCGDYLVANDGTITVPINSDPDGLCNGAYLQTLDVGPFDRTTYGSLTSELTISIPSVGEATIYIPILVGYSYSSAGQTMFPASEQATKSQLGGATGKRRRPFNYGIRGFFVGNGKALGTGSEIGGLAIGGDFTTNLNAVRVQTKGGIDLTHNQVFQGATWGPLASETGFDGVICWCMVRPYPCIINNINAFLEIEEH